MDLKEIKRLISIVEESKVSHVSIESDGTKIEIKKEFKEAAPSVASFQLPAQMPAAAAPAPAPQAQAPVAEPASAPAADDPNVKTITSEMVGTFYSAPNPDADPFVKVGDTIKNGQTLCVIEAMKLFNEIEAEISGTVVEICVSNAEPVEFGQALFKVRT